jgi:hypothetical protein
MHPRSMGSTLGYARGGETHHAGLTTVGGGKGLRTRVLNRGEGVPVGGDNSRELLRVGKREGCVMGMSGEGGERSAVFEPG